MVEDEFRKRVEHELLRTDRDHGILTKDDREYLLNKKEIKSRSQTERDARRRIRNRIKNAILDFFIIDSFLEERDLNQIFGTPRQTGEDIDPIIQEGIHAMISVLYYASVEDEQTFEKWIEAGLRHAARRESGPFGKFEEPSVQVEITPAKVANAKIIWEKIDQKRFDDLNSVEIEFLLQFIGSRFENTRNITETSELHSLQESLERYFNDV